MIDDRLRLDGRPEELGENAVNINEPFMVLVKAPKDPGTEKKRPRKKNRRR